MQEPRRASSIVINPRAALLAGLLSAIVGFGVGAGLGALAEGNPWFASDVAASLVLGPSILPPSGAFDARLVAIAAVLTLVASMAGVLFLAALVHGWGPPVAGSVGGIVGWVAHTILIFGFPLFMPWIASYQHGFLTAVYVIWGIVAGATYESLNRDKFGQRTGPA